MKKTNELENNNYQCPCIQHETPVCGNPQCWHFTPTIKQDCYLCHKTGYVKKAIENEKI